jgi:hypothetical protein
MHAPKPDTRRRLTALASKYVYVYVCVFMYTMYVIPGRMPADASTALASMYVYVYVCVFMYASM